MVTVITKTIGPTGRDYATFTLAESDVTNIGTSGNLVANDEAIVFEADAGDYSENLQFFTGGGLTCDATRNVTWTHAAGAEHGGQFESGANITGYFLVQEDFAVGDGLSISNGLNITNESEGAIVRNAMCYSATTNAIKLSKGGTATHPCVVENCVGKSDATRPVDIRSEGAGVDSHWRVVNCTVFVSTGYIGFNLGLSSSDNLYLNLTNNLVIGDRSYLEFAGPTVTLTGSNNFGSSTSPFPVAVQGSPYPITASTAYDPGAGDFALYVGKNGALLDSPNNDVIDGGVGPASNSDVPTTDILGDTRSGTTTNPGAFALAQATTVITRTIGPSGRDYATFSLAEAAVTNIGGSADLVFENEAIVFQADAGTYVEILNVDSTLVSDVTRNVTYRCADREARPVVGSSSTASPIRMRDDFTHFDGIDAFDSSGGAYKLFDSQVGLVIENCEVTSDGAGVYLSKSGANIGSSSAPCIIRNVVTKARWGVQASGADCFVEVVNCTFLPGNTSPAGQPNYNFSSTGSSACKLVNCIVLDTRADRQLQITGATVTGSNNIGVLGGVSSRLFSTNGLGSELTPIDDPEQPAVGDYAIHSIEGRLYDTSGNDALQAGVGPSANSDVPTTDITGEARSGATCNPGAFEATVVLSISTPAAGALNNSPDFRVHLDRRVTDASFGVSAVYDSASDSTTFTLPYRLNTYARMQVVTRKTSGANAGELLSVTATDANAGTVTVAGNHTSTAVFIGETYIMKYEFSTPHLQAQQRMSPTKGASHRIRYGTVTFADTSFFEVKVKPKGGDAYTYTFNGNLLNEPETLLGQVAVYDGDFKFPVMADHDRATVTLENDSPLPSRFLGCEWEAFYHSRIGQRSRF